MARSALASLALLLVVATCAVLAAPPFPCTYTSASNQQYDLSNMYRNPGSGQVDYQLPVDGSGTFYVNVCGEAAETACTPPNGVCQIGSDNVGYGNGDAGKATWDALPNGGTGVKVTYPDGSGGTCNGLPRTSYLLISCDASAGDGVIDSVSENPNVHCQYTINMRSKWACPTSGPTPPGPPSPPGPPGPSPPGKNGSPLSIGSIILITVACVIPVYLVVGGIIKWKVYGAEPLSIDIIPNVGFWAALPFLVKDGFVYFVQKVSGGRFCAEYGSI